MKEKRQRKPTPFDALAASYAQRFAHLHTATIDSKRRILEFEGGEIDAAVNALTAALANQRDRRKEIDAALQGLAVVIDRR